MNGLAGFDYTRVTEPGPILAVRLPGIYADVANTKNAIIETNYTNGQIIYKDMKAVFLNSQVSDVQ
jgi:hypothetical protein